MPYITTVAAHQYRRKITANHHFFSLFYGSKKKSPVNCFSSLSDQLSDFFGSSSSRRRRRPKRKDELESTTLEVTRLGDVVAGSRAALLDAISGPAAGDAERELARRNRIQTAWAAAVMASNVAAVDGNDNRSNNNNNSNNTDPTNKQNAVLSALVKFEEKEADRRKKLWEVLGTWREQQLDKMEEEKSSGSRNDKGFFSTLFSKYFQRRERENPQKMFAEQLTNEAELFQDLRDCNVDIDTVRDIVNAATTTITTAMDLNNDNIRERSMKTTTSQKEQQQQQQQQQQSGNSITQSCYVYVIDFKGNTLASKSKALAEEISAILSLPAELRPSEVILRLKSPGGTVTGYGLCSAELSRLTKARVTLTVCVDEVAASGGYLMACVADNILASPFAAIGSIGVVASTPNVAKRMNDEGVQVIQSTAGKYKRTVTPWHEPVEEELEKLQEDVNTIHRHFIEHVSKHRGERIPNDVADVATGEVWYGEDAVSRGLVDKLITSEEYIQQKLREKCEVLHIKRVSKQTPLSWLVGEGIDDDGVLISSGEDGVVDPRWRSRRPLLRYQRYLEPGLLQVENERHNNSADRLLVDVLLKQAGSLSLRQKREFLNEYVQYHMQDE